MFPLNVRKDMENSLPATFQFWDIPEIRKCLDENICHIFDLFVTFFVMGHFSKKNSKENFVDSEFGKLCGMTRDKQNIFLIKEFEHILT